MDDEYPVDIQVFVDGIDITYHIFGVDLFTPDDTNFMFTDIDLTPYVTSGGIHYIMIKAGSGQGRIDCRVEIA